MEKLWRERKKSKGANKMKTFRFLYVMYVDIKANDVEEAKQQFQEADLDPCVGARKKFHACGFRNLMETYEVDENGARKD